MNQVWMERSFGSVFDWLKKNRRGLRNVFLAVHLTSMFSSSGYASDAAVSGPAAGLVVAAAVVLLSCQ